MDNFIKGTSEFELALGIILLVILLISLALSWTFSQKYRELSRKFTELSRRQTAEQTLLEKTLSESQKSMDLVSAVLESDSIAAEGYYKKVEEVIEKFKNQSEDVFPLILALADKVNAFENTLVRMDSSSRGYKQLHRSLNEMKAVLTESGFTLVGLLGKPYVDGMKVFANFIDDEELPEGSRLITRVIKPQVNYRGQMIQTAQVTVSQNQKD